MDDNTKIAITVLEGQKAGLLEQVAKIDEMIKQMSLNAQLLNSNTNTNTPIKAKDVPNDNRLPDGSTWERKVAAAVKHFNKFVHSKQVIEYLSETYGYSIESLQNGNISTAFNKLKNSGSLHKHQADQNNRNTFWGSPKWVDSESKILPEYMYDEKYLFKTNAKIVIDI